MPIFGRDVRWLKIVCINLSSQNEVLLPDSLMVQPIPNGHILIPQWARYMLQLWLLETRSWALSERWKSVMCRIPLGEDWENSPADDKWTTNCSFIHHHNFVLFCLWLGTCSQLLTTPSISLSLLLVFPWAHRKSEESARHEKRCPPLQPLIINHYQKSSTHRIGNILKLFLVTNLYFSKAQ